MLLPKFVMVPLDAMAFPIPIHRPNKSMRQFEAVVTIQSRVILVGSSVLVPLQVPTQGSSRNLGLW